MTYQQFLNEKIGDMTRQEKYIMEAARWISANSDEFTYEGLTEAALRQAEVMLPQIYSLINDGGIHENAD